jgi:hypothetical protein
LRFLFAFSINHTSASHSSTLWLLSNSFVSPNVRSETVISPGPCPISFDCVTCAAIFSDLHQVVLLGKFFHMRLDRAAVGAR